MKSILFSILLKQKVKKVKKVSRIDKKNIVYYCELKNNRYAVKVYKCKYNGISRFNNELYWLKKFQKETFFKVPKIYLSKKFFCWNILVVHWIDGFSVKQQLDNSDDDLWTESLCNCLDVLQKIWNSKIDFDKVIDDSFDYKSGENVDSVIKKFKRKKKKLQYYYDELLFIYKSIQDSIIFKKSLINSDISLHEFLLQGRKIALLDYEYFCIGDINNDLAGIFYSATNSFINKKDDSSIKKVYKIIENNSNFNLDNFIFFLIQRILLADCFAWDSIKDFERIKYYQIVIELYFGRTIL